jgi:hypothetical protein
VIVTSSTLTPNDRARLEGYVSSVVGKAGFDTDHFMSEVRRATANAPARS